MGRPPLKTGIETLPVVSRLPRDTVEEIDAHTGSASKRAAFIREAIDEKLRRVRRAAKRKPDA